MGVYVITGVVVVYEKKTVIMVARNSCERTCAKRSPEIVAVSVTTMENNHPAIPAHSPTTLLVQVGHSTLSYIQTVSRTHLKRSQVKVRGHRLKNVPFKTFLFVL